MSKKVALKSKAKEEVAKTPVPATATKETPKVEKTAKTEKISNKEVSKKVAEGKEAKVKKSKKSDVVAPVKLNVPKAFEGKELRPETGTRFNLGSARQLAFENVMKLAKEGKNIKEIRKNVSLIRKENGAKHNLDPAYVNFVLATHSDFFESFTDGTVKVIKEPTVDKEALKKGTEKIQRMKETTTKVKNARKAATKAVVEKKLKSKKK